MAQRRNDSLFTPLVVVVVSPATPCAGHSLTGHPGHSPTAVDQGLRGFATTLNSMTTKIPSLLLFPPGPHDMQLGTRKGSVSTQKLAPDTWRPPRESSNLPSTTITPPNPTQFYTPAETQITLDKLSASYPTTAGALLNTLPGYGRAKLCL